MIPVVFQDKEILVLEKPAGLVTTSSETNNEQSLQNILSSGFRINIERSGIVHRLDKDTSGLLVVAKTLKSLKNLQAQFKERLVKKEYLALVHGQIKEGGRIEGSIARNPGNREKFTVLDKDGKEAVTEYIPVGNFQFSISNFKTIFNDLNEQSSRAGFHPLTKIQIRKLERMQYNKFTLLKCHPLTGRTHQIRVHLKYLGFPIVGDEKYGGRKTVRLDHRWCPRQFLHAASLEFNHPITGKRISFESKLPEDLRKAFDMLEEVQKTDN